MPPSIASLTNRWAATDPRFRRDALLIAAIAAFHLAALALVAWTEVAVVPKAFFLLTWGVLNFVWLALLRRPAVSAALSLLMIVALILLSRLKYDIILTTANFLDVWIINDDTVQFLLMVIPGLTQKLVIASALTGPVLGLLGWLDRFRVRLRTAAIGLVACLAGITALSLAFPQEDSEAFFGDSCLQVLTLGRRHDPCADDARIHGIRCRRDRQPEDTASRDVRADQQAAAHHPGAR
jgi:hypothetical protein